MAPLPLLLGMALLGNPFGGAVARGTASQGWSAPALAMTSPWWEDYDKKERYLCSEKGSVVVERNASQAALINGGVITTFFREASDGPALVYRIDDFRLIVRGDELILERLPMTITCVRSEQG
jgi:hypothetical protein